MPSLKWYVHPAIDFTKRLYGTITRDNQTLYLTDGVIAVPVRFSSYLSWYDPSTGALARMLNLAEAWDHVNEMNPVFSPPYNGAMVLLAGYRSWLLAVNVTDGSSYGEVWIIRRYTDDSILVYNRGYPSALPVDVNDPPSSLGYSVQTNGTRGTGKTTLSQGQYVLFYKGTAPSVDSARGVFATSPIGSSKSKDYEVKVSATTFSSPVGGAAVVTPAFYTGIRAPEDFDPVSYGALLRVFRNAAAYAGMAYGGAYGIGTPVGTLNLSGTLTSCDVNYGLQMNTDYFNRSAPLKDYSGWAEDDSGSVKAVIISVQTLLMNYYCVPTGKRLTYIMYDVERGEEDVVSMVRPLSNMTLYGATVPIMNPSTFEQNEIHYIDVNNYWYVDRTSSAPGTTVQSVWGFVNVLPANEVLCAAALTVVATDDPDFTAARPDAVKSYRSMVGFNAGAWENKTIKAGKTYIVGVRMKEYYSYTDLLSAKMWVQNRPFKVSTDISKLPVYPLTAWLVGVATDTVTVDCPSVVTGGQPFTVNVSCPTRPNKTAYVMVVDGYGNVVSSAQGTLNSSGNASISVTAPQQVGRYKVYAVVAGDRTVP